jgi:folate-binding protein YgfZ
MNEINLNSLLKVIIASGTEVKTFLQGQLTNDIYLLDNAQSNFQFSAYLNTKGRIQATFLVVKKSEDLYYLITSSDVVDKVLPRLKMYILRAKVTLTILNSNIIFSQQPHDSAIVQLVLPGNYHLVITDQDCTNTIVNQFKQYLIENGIGLIYLATHEQLIPQHINFDKINGLSFTKGCYLGQEIVARMHYLGKSKRSMYRFTSNQSIAIGNKVISPQLNNQEVGIIVEVSRLDSKEYIGLVSVQNDCTTQIYLDAELTHKLELQEITYNG